MCITKGQQVRSCGIFKEGRGPRVRKSRPSREGIRDIARAMARYNKRTGGHKTANAHETGATPTEVRSKLRGLKGFLHLQTGLAPGANPILPGPSKPSAQPRPESRTCPSSFPTPMRKWFWAVEPKRRSVLSTLMVLRWSCVPGDMNSSRQKQGFGVLRS